MRTRGPTGSSPLAILSGNLHRLLHALLKEVHPPLPRIFRCNRESSIAAFGRVCQGRFGGTDELLSAVGNPNRVSGGSQPVKGSYDYRLACREILEDFKGLHELVRLVLR